MKNALWSVAVLVTGISAFLLGRTGGLQESGRDPIAADPPAVADRANPEGPWVPVSDFQVNLIRVEAADRYLVKGAFGTGRLGIDKPCVLVYLEYKNASEARRYTGGSWPTGQLSDESGNRYRMLTDDHLLRPEKMPPILRPGESIRDVLVFEAPIAQASMLRLYVQDYYSADSGTLRGPVEISIPADTILDPGKVVR